MYLSSSTPHKSDNSKYYRLSKEKTLVKKEYIIVAYVILWLSKYEEARAGDPQVVFCLG